MVRLDLHGEGSYPADAVNICGRIGCTAIAVERRLPARHYRISLTDPYSPRHRLIGRAHSSSGVRQSRRILPRCFSCCFIHPAPTKLHNYHGERSNGKISTDPTGIGSKPFSQAALWKLSNGTAIDPDYSRSYCLVHAPLKGALVEEVDAVDCASRQRSTKMLWYGASYETLQWSGSLNRPSGPMPIVGTEGACAGWHHIFGGHHLKPLGSPHRGSNVSSSVVMSSARVNHGPSDSGLIFRRSFLTRSQRIGR